MSKDTRRVVLVAAVALATLPGCNYLTLRRDEVAKKAGISDGRVSQIFKTIPQFKTAVLQFAIDEGRHAVVLQGIASADPLMKGQPVEVREAALVRGSRG